MIGLKTAGKTAGVANVHFVIKMVTTVIAADKIQGISMDCALMKRFLLLLHFIIHVFTVSSAVKDVYPSKN